jgi:hypothetical protein
MDSAYSRLWLRFSADLVAFSHLQFSQIRGRRPYLFVRKIPLASSATAPRLPDADQLLCRHGPDVGSPGSRPSSFWHMPGSSTTPGCPDARADLRNSVDAQDMSLAEVQWLARAFPYQRFAVILADNSSGSLLLQCVGLAPTTPRRSLRRTAKDSLRYLNVVYHAAEKWTTNANNQDAGISCRGLRVGLRRWTNGLTVASVN